MGVLVGLRLPMQTCTVGCIGVGPFQVFVAVVAYVKIVAVVLEPGVSTVRGTVEASLVAVVVAASSSSVVQAPPHSKPVVAMGLPA